MNTDLDGYMVCIKHGTNRKIPYKVLSLSIRCRKFRDLDQFANKITDTLSSEEAPKNNFRSNLA